MNPADEYRKQLETNREQRISTDRGIWRKLDNYELSPGHVRRQGLTLEPAEVERLRERMPPKEGKT